MRFVKAASGLVIVIAAAARQVLAGPALPVEDGYRHNGVATCASSVCHGKVNAVEGQNVWLNEYMLWSVDDHHSRAYKTLLSDESRNMANALGLPAAHTAEACLDCHADNVPVQERGPKFQISDGVACEACHGGSESWLKSHTDPKTNHAQNLKQGMYPTENAFARASLCLSCHMGNEDKFAHHGMMAAGHPRLVFELDTFVANQPPHYNVDEDYQQRKGKVDAGYFWLAGQIVSARQQITLVKRHGGQLTSASIGVFDCHSCHHPMQPRRGKPADASQALPVGSLRLLDFSQDIVQVIIEILYPDQAAGWQQSVTALHKAAVTFKQPEVSAAANELTGKLATVEKRLQAQQPDKAALKRLRKALVTKASEGRFADYSTAEQAFLAVESLSYSLEDRNKLESGLDRIYTSLKDENSFEPEKFRQGMKGLYSSL